MATSHGVPRVSEQEPITEQARQKELEKIERYKGLVSLVTEKINAKQYTPETLNLTSQLLSLNPEYYTIWNHRRRILLSLLTSPSPSSSPSASPTSTSSSITQITNLIQNDLHFLLPLLLKFPKCYWIWNHRLWLLQSTTSYLSPSASRTFWEQELSLVTKMLARDARNFHGWGYRRLVVQRLESRELNVLAEGGEEQGEGKGEKEEVTREVKRERKVGGETRTKQELDYATRMVNSNLSNFSAWHNRSKLLPLELSESQASNEERLKVLDSELTLIQEALYTDSTDQSLWFYYNYLLANILPSPSSSVSLSPSHSSSNHPNDLITPFLTSSTLSSSHSIIRKSYIQTELTELNEMLEGDEECKYIYLALIELRCGLRRVTGNWDIPFAEGLEANGDENNAEDGGREEVLGWIFKVKELDPLRKGRWDDLEVGVRGLE